MWLAIHKSWNGRASDNPERQRAIEEYRDAARRDAVADARKDGSKPKTTRRRFREEMQGTRQARSP